jgi:hypothetical protein
VTPRRILPALLAVLALAAVPSAADAAATLYATPHPGFGATCTVASPCALGEAIHGAASGDTVVVGAGTYTGTESYEDEGKNLTIAGAVIGPGRPVIEAEVGLTGAESTISDVEIHSPGSYEALALFDGASANRVVAIGSEGDGCSIHADGTVTNSVCMSENPSFSSGLATQASGGGAMTATNVTMIGTYGFFSNSTKNPGLTMTDSIAMTTKTGGEDATFNQGLTKTIRSYLLHHEPSANVVEEASLTQTPVFLGPGDYREAPGSPSIDAGSTTAAPGELDLDGNLRQIGSKVDVGAYEFVPDAPTVSTPSVSSVTTTGAALAATINPNSGRTYYHLEYGPSSAYGSSTPVVTLPAATAVSPATFDLAGLPSGAAVHYSIVATSDGGTTRTPDATFTTASSPASPPSTVPATPVTPAPPASMLAPLLKFKGGKGGKPDGQPLLDRSTIKLSTGCGPVACDVTVAGAVKVGAKVLGALPGPKKPTHWQAGKQGAIRLKISAGLQRRVAAYLEAHPGARAKILVTATFVTADGSRATRKLTIPVRPQTL